MFPARPIPTPAGVRREDSVADAWRKRLDHLFLEHYAGLALFKLAEDLRVYEHLVWADRADTVIEVGTARGGSALWFRDRLVASVRYRRIARAHVISIDLDQAVAREQLAARDPRYSESIDLVEGDVRDEELLERVARLVRPGARCLVVEDGAHRADTTYAALAGLGHLVPEEGFFVVEDGVVDEPDLWPEDDHAVQPAIARWLETAEGRRFVRRRDLEIYGISTNVGGYLQRIG